MYKFLFFLLMLGSAFLFFSWVIDDRYFSVYQEDFISADELSEAKRILYVWSDDILPESLLSDEAKLLLDEALSFYNNAQCDKIILAGDKDAKNGNIVLEMMDYLIEAGVPVEDLIPDFYSASLYRAVYRAKEVFTLSDFYFLSDENTLLKVLYISDRLNLDLQAVSYKKIEESWLQRVLLEWQVLFTTKIFSPDVYVADKNPNYLLDY